MAETHIWGGRLGDGDEVLILLNAADEDIEIITDLHEIFYADGPEGSAEQVDLEWDVYDLWANRMDESTAGKILDGTPDAAKAVLKDLNWYNATEMSYKEGLEKGDPRLLGKKVSHIMPGGELKVLVKRHSAEVFRLRSPKKTGGEEAVLRDEL